MHGVPESFPDLVGQALRYHTCHRRHEPTEVTDVLGGLCVVAEARACGYGGFPVLTGLQLRYNMGTEVSGYGVTSSLFWADSTGMLLILAVDLPSLGKVFLLGCGERVGCPTR